MDDLDHSMHIAEYDWTSFYEESEECGLQPSLACPDDWSLSDSEDSGSSSSVFGTGQQEPQQRPAANSGEAAGCCAEEAQINPRINSATATTLQTEQPNVPPPGGDVQTESDTWKLKSTHEAELNVNAPRIARGAAGEDASGVASRAEKERWFVTLNDSPARLRARAPPLKKKRRQKKPGKHVCRKTGQQKSHETGLESEMSNENNDSEAGRDTAGGGEGNPEGDQTGEEDNLSEKLAKSRPPKENTNDPTTVRNKHDPSSSAPTSHDTLPPSEPSRLHSLVSDELEDGVEFFSTHSCDSESYLSATESLEEPPHLLVETQQLQGSLPLTDNYLFSLTENAGADDPSLPRSVTATNCRGDGSTDVEPALVSPSAGQRANKTPGDNSTLPCAPSDTPGPQKHETNVSASGCISCDQLSLLPVPDLTVTPCPLADSPETYAKAAGHPRPVYAISAFWDEMEKLTINDILQLRMGKSTPPGDTQETVTPDADDFPTHRVALVDPVEYNLSEGGLVDASDAADSDYFTQPDESKPGRSSCEFSTSDFEEDYWQFLGASRNPSPDPPNKNHQGTGGSTFSEEEESTGSEGKETPVPSEDFAGQCFDSNAFISSDLAWPRRITKSKSVRNVQALNTEGVSLQVLLGNDEDSLFLGRCPSPEENVLLKASDSLGTLIPAPVLSNTHVDMFEYFFTEDKAKRGPRCVYDPEDISVAPVFDYTLCTFRDDSQCAEAKPIPIFSCSHPTVRELTFPTPDYVFLIADCEEEDDASPIRVVSRAFTRGSDCVTPAAAPRGFRSGKGLLSIRKIGFHDKGSMWCGRSGAWVFPVEAEKIPIKSADPAVAVLTEGGVASTPSQLFRELEAQRRIVETLQTRREGIFSTLKQSDMCLVCIAFASWVLRSSDPEAADAWKAALLANVSALSAIQYLRHYVKKMNPSQDHP